MGRTADTNTWVAVKLEFVDSFARPELALSADRARWCGGGGNHLYSASDLAWALRHIDMRDIGLMADQVSALQQSGVAAEKLDSTDSTVKAVQARKVRQLYAMPLGGLVAGAGPPRAGSIIASQVHDPGLDSDGHKRKRHVRQALHQHRRKY